MSKRRDAGEERFREKAKREKDFQGQLPGADDETLPPPVEPIHTQDKTKRNEPCPCGSGKKYKQCCGKTN